MLDQVEALKSTEEVRKAFETKLVNKAASAFTCWGHHIGTALWAANQVVEAGQKMGVTSATTFSDGEVKELAEALSPLAELEMHDRIREILLPKFADKGYGKVVMKILAEKNL